MTALYNEIEPFAASWLGNLIAAGHIAPGTVETRSIRDLRPEDVRDATQAHFFAGIGVWSYALTLAGIADDVRVWTGSCPCQPFSSAGKRKGLEDERHLWPAWFALIRECRPAIIFGEQVASAGDWLDVVSRDLEAEGYAFGAAVLGAHSVGAPHIRQRFYFVAHARGERLDGIDARLLGRGSQPHRAEVAWRGEVGVMEHASREQVGLPGRARIDRSSVGELGDARGTRAGRITGAGVGAQAEGGSERREHGRGGDGALAPGAASLVGNASEPRPQGRRERRDGPDQRAVGPSGLASFWADAEWLPCKDGKLRPVEPGTFPLAHGATSRVGRLRAYGNAIVAQQAALFIRAAFDAMSSHAPRAEVSHSIPEKQAILRAGGE